MPGKVTPNTPIRLSARQWNEFVDAAEWVKRNRRALEMDARRKDTRPIRVKNATIEAAPIGSLLHMTDMRTSNVPEITQPDSDDATPLAVALEPIPATGSDELGRAMAYGVVRVAVDDYDGYGAVVPGDRIGPQADSWYAAKAEQGPLIVLGAVPAADQPTGLAAGVGLVWAIFDSSGRGIPDVYLTTSAESGGEITAKRVDSDGNVVGADETFIVLPEPTSGS